MIMDLWRFARLPKWLRTSLIERGVVEQQKVDREVAVAVDRSAQRLQPSVAVIVGSGGGGGGRTWFTHPDDDGLGPVPAKVS